jgi:hypothetical protein
MTKLERLALKKLHKLLRKKRLDAGDVVLLGQVMRELYLEGLKQQESKGS